LQSTNIGLTSFNARADDAYAKTRKQFEVHTRKLQALKVDLLDIFRRIRALKKVLHDAQLRNATTTTVVQPAPASAATSSSPSALVPQQQQPPPVDPTPQGPASPAAHSAT